MEIRKNKQYSGKYIATALALSSLLAHTASAESLKDGGYVGCLTEDYLDQFVTAAVKDDRPAMNYMLSNTLCVPLSSQYQISVLDNGFTQVKIRVYVGDGAVELWTVREAIQR